MSNDRLPFYFAVSHGAKDRAAVPGHVRRTFDVDGRIEFVSSDERMRLYRVVAR